MAAWEQKASVTVFLFGDWEINLEINIKKVEQDYRKSCKASQSEIMILESSIIMRNMLQMIHERSVNTPSETETV